MSELDAILQAIDDRSARGSEFALATVVGVRGSTYRGLAARQLVGADGSSVGTVSGGCLDNDLRVIAGRVMETGVPELVEFDLTADDEAIWGWGIGCNGVTRLLVEPADRARELAGQLTAERPAAVIHDLGEALGRRRYLADATEAPPDLADEVLAALDSGRSRVAAGAEGSFLIEVIGSRPRLVVCGAGHDAVPLVRLGAQLGFEVVVVDDRRQFLSPDRFPEAEALVFADPAELATAMRLDRRTFVVLISHNYLRDLAYLRSLIGTEVAYVGALGPGERLARLLSDLEEEGADLDSEELDRLHGPAGLDIGAEGPTEIALSIMAEVLAVARGYAGGPLTERKGPDRLRDRRSGAVRLP